MTGICSGRVVIVTGAARGLGRAHALAFAAEGASVVVNDYGLDLHGEVPTDASGAPADETEVVGSEGNGADATAAQQVVHEITAGGGTAVANHDDVADWAGAQRLVGTAIDTFGRLDVLVNNAGFLRDRMLANLSEEEWDAVIRVHLKGHFAPLRHAATYWRAEAKAGRQPDARVINTSSGAGLQGSVGQGNYSAAKAGIATMTLVAAAEMGRYGVTVNAIAPVARTRMTEATFAEMMATGENAFDAMAPENVSPLLVWLGSTRSAHVTGRVFEVEGGKVALAEGWRHGVPIDKGARWHPAELGEAVDTLIATATPPEAVYGTAP